MKEFKIKTDTGEVTVTISRQYFEAEVHVTVFQDSYTVRMSTNQLTTLLATSVLEHLNDVVRIQTEKQTGGLK